MFQRLLLTATLLFIAAGSAAAQVNVSSPANGATVGSPVRFVASATAANPVTAMRIYVDSTSVYTVNANKIDTSLALASGWRNVTVVAWDSTGAAQTTKLSINVSGTTTTTTTTSTGNVTVSQPAAGATVSSPTRFVASASAPKPITAMKIYVDGNDRFTTYSGSLDTSLELASGTRQVTVQAWDSSGAVYKNSFSVTVGSTSTTSAPVTSAVNGFYDVDQITGWESCDKCAGPGGDGPSTPYSMSQFRTTPAIDGSSAEFWIGGDTPYSQALWWKQLGARDGATNFVYELSFYMTNPGASQALEFDVNQSVNGKKYIFGTECNLKETRSWRVWDGATDKWYDTGIACPVPQAYTWNHLAWEFQRTGDGKMRFVSVTLNGKKSYVNRYYNPDPSSVRELNVAVQLDGDHKQTDHSVWVDKIHLKYW